MGCASRSRVRSDQPFSQGQTADRVLIHLNTEPSANDLIIFSVLSCVASTWKPFGRSFQAQEGSEEKWWAALNYRNADQISKIPFNGCDVCRNGSKESGHLHSRERGCEAKRFAAPLWLSQASGPQAQNSRLEEDAILIVLPLESACYAQSRGFANERSLPAVDELPRREPDSACITSMPESE